jgi:hypothetical protein
MDMYCIVYDITNRNSFKNCAMWLEQLSQSRGDHNIFGNRLKNESTFFCSEVFFVQVS